MAWLNSRSTSQKGDAAYLLRNLNSRFCYERFLCLQVLTQNNQDQQNGKSTGWKSVGRIFKSQHRNLMPTERLPSTSVSFRCSPSCTAVRAGVREQNIWTQRFDPCVCLTPPCPDSHLPWLHINNCSSIKCITAQLDSNEPGGLSFSYILMLISAHAHKHTNSLDVCITAALTFCAALSVFLIQHLYSCLLPMTCTLLWSWCPAECKCWSSTNCLAHRYFQCATQIKSRSPTDLNNCFTWAKTVSTNQWTKERCIFLKCTIKSLSPTMPPCSPNQHWHSVEIVNKTSNQAANICKHHFGKR